AQMAGGGGCAAVSTGKVTTVALRSTGYVVPAEFQPAEDVLPEVILDSGGACDHGVLTGGRVRGAAEQRSVGPRIFAAEVDAQLFVHRHRAIDGGRIGI